MFGSERDTTKTYVNVNAAVNVYARRLPISAEVWALCYFTQTAERNTT